MAVGKTVGDLYTANHVAVIGTEKLEVETDAGVSGAVCTSDIRGYVKEEIVNDLTTGGAAKFASAETVKTLNTEKVDKVTGKSLILDTEIQRLASVTNQTLEGLGGAPLDSPTFTGNVAVPTADADGEAVNKGQMDTAIAAESTARTQADGLKADKVTVVTTGNFAGLDATGNLTDSGKKATDFEPADATILKEADIANNLTTEEEGKVGDARQLKVLNDELALKVDKSAVKQTTGTSETDVMSQKAVTDELALKADQTDIDQLAGEVSLLDAVQGAKIKDIESIISTMNPNQSAQLSVSGVSPLSLSKNAANGGMGVKLEGLTEDVGGVITNFEPTGRVRSVGKNLFNPKSVTTKRNLDNRDVVDIIGYLGTLDTALYSNGIYYSNIGVKKLIGLPFRASTQYTISLDAKYIAGPENNFVIRFYYSDGTNNYIVGTTSVWGNRKMTSVAGKSVVAILLEGSGSSHQIAVDINTIDVENSVSISGFAPYRETSLYLTAPELRSNGTVKDEIRKGANGYELVKRISEVEL